MRPLFRIFYLADLHYICLLEDFAVFLVLASDPPDLLLADIFPLYFRNPLHLYP